MKASETVMKKSKEFGPPLKVVFGITDGGRFKCQNYGNEELQNAFYEGFTQQEEVTNLFVFNFFGEVIHAAISFPGSWHHNKLACLSGLYYPKLSDERTPPEMAILRDSAFVKNATATNAKFLRARKSNDTSDIPQSKDSAAIDMMFSA
ncbi:DDE endonuclease [Gracilaria domingensis]|nr:DDE endonuclease [Gracilaria domingensis]